MTYVIDAASCYCASSKSQLEWFRERYLDKLSRFNPVEHNVDDPRSYYVTISFEYLVGLHDLMKAVGQIIVEPGCSFRCKDQKGIDGHITIYDDWME